MQIGGQCRAGNTIGCSIRSSWRFWSVPLTKTSLDYDAERQELISRAAGLAYPIRDGIPIMLPEEARKLD